MATVLAMTVLIAACGGKQSRLASHMKRGQDYFQKGDLAKAGIEFRNAMQIDPKDPHARVMAGKTALQLGQLRNAYALLQSVVEDHPDDIEARMVLGRLLITAGDAKQGLEVIRPALDKQPNNASLLALRSLAKVAMKDAAGARADADRALAADPQNEDAIDLRAGLYRQDGNVPAAIKLVGAAAAAHPELPGYHQVLVSLYLSDNHPELAEEQLRALVNLKPQQLDYRAQLAVFLSRSKRLDDAQKVLTDAVRALPANDDAKLLQVDFLAQQRSHEAAEKALEGYIAADPDNYKLRLALGAMLQKFGESAKAVAAYSDIVQRAGTEPSGLVARDRLAVIAVGEKREADAQRYLAEVLKVSPRDNDALALRGQLSLEHGDSASAIADLRAVLRDQPRNAAINRVLALALISHKDMALAEEPLRTAVDAAPTDASLRVMLAEVLFTLKHPDQGIDVLQQGLKAMPVDNTLNQALVRAYETQKNFAAAAKVADDYQKAKPNDAAPYLLAAEAAHADNRLEDAQNLLEKALSIQPRAFDVLSDLVHLQVQRGHGAQAVSRLQKMLAATPKDALLQNLLSDVYLQQKDYKAGQQAAAQALADQPNWWMPYRNLALAKTATDDLPGAIEAYQNGLKLAPREIVLLTGLGVLYQRTGKIDEATKLYESWVSQDPKSQIAANNLAMLLVSYRTDKASLDRAQELTSGFSDAGNGDLLDTAGWVRFKRGDFTQALPVLQHAAELLPNSREVHYHLGMAELRAGQTDRARTDLEAALAGAVQFPGVDDARAALATLKHSAG
ncbi:MAG TPA: tetratricopeptide repeat protein [Steroidobacteraceae bacterium]|nr:tetratricopeptide repeat protein [Steroidobacteraceae bacterium]